MGHSNVTSCRRTVANDAALRNNHPQIFVFVTNGGISGSCTDRNTSAINKMKHNNQLPDIAVRYPWLLLPLFELN
jgi:hypothetical protein